MVTRLTSITLFVVVAAAGCGTTTRYTPTNSPPRAMTSRSVETVEVYTSSLPTRPFVEVGIIQSRQSSGLSFDEMPEIIGEMRGYAAKRGCDGLIINGASDKVEGTSSASTTTTGGKAPTSSTTVSNSTTTLEGFWGACIMYTGEATQQASGG
jgi:hypothetical protein